MRVERMYEQRPWCMFSNLHQVPTNVLYTIYLLKLESIKNDTSYCILMVNVFLCVHVGRLIKFKIQNFQR